ncbi:hypothetical protein EFO83_00105 [Lacticaseibacillus rhamnosus]|nr:hypothetical protein [Lacticaseibacillus rhamnosus]
MIHVRNPSFLGTQYTKIKSARKICTRTENTAGEKRWILSKILLMIGTAILTTWLQLVAQ